VTRTSGIRTGQHYGSPEEAVKHSRSGDGATLTLRGQPAMLARSVARRLALLLVCASAIVAPTRAASAAAPACDTRAWPQLERTAGHSGTGPPGTRIGKGTIGRLRRVWQASIGYGNTGAVDVASSPLVVCGAVYVAAADGRVYAFTASTGRRLWRTSAMGGRFFGAAIGHGTLFAIMNGVLYAFATRAGELVWQTSISGFLGGAPMPPLVVGNTLYVIDDGELTVLDATNGSVRFRVPAGQGTFLSVPAAANGLIYVGVDQSLDAFDAATGALRWSGPTGDAVWSTPTISGGSVYVGSSDHSVYAFDAVTGTPRWTAPTGDRVYATAPVAAAGNVYAGSLDRRVHAFDAATGAERWTFSTGDSLTGSPAVANGVVFIGSLDGTFYALDAATGSALWSDAVGRPIGSSPAIGAESVYIATARTLFAYRVS
jgi:outer membrane protein assembly factor BamB